MRDGPRVSVRNPRQCGIGTLLATRETRRHSAERAWVADWIAWASSWPQTSRVGFRPQFTAKGGNRPLCRVDCVQVGFGQRDFAQQREANSAEHHHGIRRVKCPARLLDCQCGFHLAPPFGPHSPAT